MCHARPMDTTQTPDDDELLTRREAARLARVSYNGIRNWERLGRLTPIRVMNGRVEMVMYRKSEVEAVIRERVENVMGEEIGSEAKDVEVRLLREDRERLIAELEAERRRFERLLERILARKPEDEVG